MAFLGVGAGRPEQFIKMATGQLPDRSRHEAAAAPLRATPVSQTTPGTIATERARSEGRV